MLNLYLAGGWIALSQQAADPWDKAQLLEPAALAASLETPGATAPMILCVGFPDRYRSKHILGSVLAGPASKAEGLEALQKEVASVRKDSDILIYCGCCPMDRCPNLRPAFRKLQELGFTHVRVLRIPTNMQEDWYAKGYPSQAGSEVSN